MCGQVSDNHLFVLSSAVFIILIGIHYPLVLDRLCQSVTDALLQKIITQLAIIANLL